MRQRYKKICIFAPTIKFFCMKLALKVNKVTSLHYILLLCGTFCGVCLVESCSSEQKSAPNIDTINERVPDMVTHDVTMLISDSGIIKYRAITSTWVRFGEKGAESYQYFPDGIEFERIDTVFNATESIVADTAYNWEDQQLWHLIDHVKVKSVKGEEFRTNDLYWDMKHHKVYSDSFIQIRRAEDIIEGYGFTSTDDFSQYEIKKTNGVFQTRE